MTPPHFFTTFFLNSIQTCSILCKNHPNFVHQKLILHKVKPLIYVFNFILILGDNLGHLKEEVQELQTTLKEEQFYSTELKKEVERLSTAVHKSTEEQTVETSEIDLYETQIKALSEAKDLRKFTKLENSFKYKQIRYSVVQ